MAAEVQEELMGAGSWKVDLDYSPSIRAELVRDDGTPHKVHALIYDPDDNLMYPPLLLLSVVGDEYGLTIGGRNLLWWLGLEEEGLIIEDREYVSGANKLSNGAFDLAELYWRRVSEESNWAFSTGSASNPGGMGKDDVLQSDEKFPTRPGYAYRMRVEDVTATGRVRARTVFEGRFDPANLLAHGGFEGGAGVGWSAATHLAIVAEGARSGTYAMRVIPIAKPQLIANSTFDAGTNWSVADQIGVSGGTLVLTPIPLPQYLPNPTLESGDTGWTVSPYMAIENNPTEAFEGDWVLRVGPIGQHQVVVNGSFEDGLTNWVQVAGAWSTSTATHVDGATSATTGGVVGGAMKSLQADSDASTPAVVDYFPANPAEAWQFEGYLCSGTVGTSDEADGQAHLQFYIVDQNYPLYDSWVDLITLDGTEEDKDKWRYGQNSFSPQPDKVGFVPMLTIYGHTAGSWYLDGVKATRTRGNNSGIYSADFPAIPNQRYRFSALVNSDNRVGGDITLRMIFKGTGEVDVESNTTQSHPWGKWVKVTVEGTCPSGYETVTAAIDGDDIVGGSFWLDNTLLEKADNNTRRTEHLPFAVTPDQRYLLGGDVQFSEECTGGSVRVGVVFSGDGVEDETVAVEQSWSDDLAGWAHLSTEARPGPGYDTATPFVQSKDIDGGNVLVDNVTLTKMDNNTDSSAGSSIAVTPERTYRWLQAVRSGTNLQRGTVKLSVRCTRTGYDDVIFDSSPMEATGGAWKFIDFSFTPPSGYATIIPSIVGTDVEGDNWYLDEGEIRDTDTATAVFDTALDSPVLGWANLDTTAPVGAESVRVELIAEQGTTSVSVGSVSLARTGVTPATGNAIVAQLLTDPETGGPLSITAGTINCPEVILYDWLILNRTNRDALNHYCTVVSEPPREYRLDPDRTLNVGTSETVFTDHSPDSATPIVLLPEDIDVEDLPNAEANSEARVNRIQVIGAERQTVGGGTFLITATADVPGETEVDYNGNAFTRTRQVHDGTVDHLGYAQAYADDLAAREAEPALALSATLTGINTRPAFDVGDWIYAYEPEAGLEDVDNVTVIEGQTVFPRRVRVLNRTRQLGPAHTIMIRRTDGTTFKLSGVLWSDRDETTLTIGDRLPEWEADPQGGAVGGQYLRDRASKPR